MPAKCAAARIVRNITAAAPPRRAGAYTRAPFSSTLSSFIWNTLGGRRVQRQKRLGLS